MVLVLPFLAAPCSRSLAPCSISAAGRTRRGELHAPRYLRSRFNQFHVRKVTSVTFCVACGERPPHQLRVGTNKEVRQRNSRRRTTTGSSSSKSILPVSAA